MISINRWQKPTLVISLADNRYDGQAPVHYVHLRVLNKDTFWRRWIGGGTAVNCKCTLTVNGLSFVTKWADREPWRTQVVFDAFGRPTVALRVPDQEHIDQAKLDVIRPGETKHADVAVRARGDSYCYIHTPENFFEKEYPRGPETTRLPPGEFDASAFIECDGYRTENFDFAIVNGEGTDAGLLRLQPTNDR